jgi:hypothetical protein
MESERKRLWIFVLTRFLDANRSPPRIKSGAGFRWKTLWPRIAAIAWRICTAMADLP